MNQALLDRVLKSPRLPSLPTIAIEVIELVQQQDVNIKQIANTIQHDPALCTKILKTVNSSFYGQASSVTTISHALVILGLNSVKTLALGFTLVGNLQDQANNCFDHMAFWKRSLYTATAARALAKRCGLVQQEEAFLGGLLQDLGMLALAQTLGTQYRTIIDEAGSNNHRRLVSIERRVLETDHATIGAALARQWRLPLVLTASVEFHENPEGAPEDLLPLVRCVSLGNLLADVVQSDEPGEAIEAYRARARDWFDISDEEADSLIKSIHRDTVEMKRLFDLPTGDLDHPDQILARANEALMQLNLQQAQQTNELQQRNQQLVEQALTDGLTGVANRRHFNEFILESFSKVKPGGPPLSVVFLDTDHFKPFNDNYGHQVGDRVLVELGAALSDNVPQGALVARYGGEEFAIVLPNCDRIASARLAEGLRRVIEEIVVESDEGEALSVTASLGVATHDGSFFTHPDHLVKAADQAVYAAKASGRNCVRIFTPRPTAMRRSA
jgi:two-component system cell cycle response regulator